MGLPHTDLADLSKHGACPPAHLQVTSTSSFSAGAVLIILAFDILLYAFLAWYCDKVGPPPLSLSCLPEGLTGAA